MVAVLLALGGLRVRTGVDATPMPRGSRASEGGFVVMSVAECRAVTELAVCQTRILNTIKTDLI